jgi:hypothetical protein
MSPKKLNKPGKKVDNRPAPSSSVTVFEAPTKREPNSYCNSCKFFEDKPYDSLYGTWDGYCSKLNLGRRYHSDKCLKAE